MNYYDSMMVVLVGLKVVLLLLLIGPWVVGRLKASRFSFIQRCNQRSLRHNVSALEDSMRNRRRASVAVAIQRSVMALQREVVSIDWTKVLKASFMLLFVAYPGELGDRRGG